MSTRELPSRLTNDQYFASSSFRIFHELLEGTIGLHWHEFYEVTFVAGGKGTNIVNGVAVPVARGSIFLLTPADFHQIGADEGERLEVYNLIFSDEWMEAPMREMLFGGSVRLSADLDEAGSQSMVGSYSVILNEAAATRAGQKLMVRGALDRILVELYRHCVSDGRQGAAQASDGLAQPTPNPGIQEALIYIHHRFREPLTLEDAAAQARLSPNYFSDLFRRTTGTAFQHYLLNLRLNFAKSLIQSSTLPISEISYISGFNTLTHFEKMFRRKFGTAPRSCRTERE